MKKSGRQLEDLSFFHYFNGESWIDSTGCHWETPQGILQGSILEFCCCGEPENNLLYILEGLKWILDKQTIIVNFDRFWNHGKEIFGNENAMNFFFYWADQHGFTEHGGSIPGWLIEKGKILLNDLYILRDLGWLSDSGESEDEKARN